MFDLSPQMREERSNCRAEILKDVPEAHREKFQDLLEKILSDVPQPEVVLSRLGRFLDSVVSRSTQLDFMCRAPYYLRLFITLVDQSAYLTDILCRNPEFLSWLYEEIDLSKTPTLGELTESVMRMVSEVSTFDGRCKVVRRFRRREFLRIAARDLFAHLPLEIVTEDLSNLADACLHAVYWSAREELVAKYGVPLAGSKGNGGTSEATFCILALGKLGGKELNFSSDIDLVFLYSEEGETSGGHAGKIDNGSFFCKLSEWIVKGVSEETSEGHVFRVDVRLRPYGRVGALAVSLDSAFTYYQSAARMWEKQALIKARPAAGDLQLGEAFLERIRPLVFPKFFDDETLEEIRKVKSQTELYIEEKGLTDLEVKRGRGGIRDIEFTVQMLQLLNGGRFPEIRERSTLGALRALGFSGLLSALEADVLATNYVFLRTVEHRLQLKEGLQTHTLPREPSELSGLSLRLGYKDADSFLRDYRERTETNRKILERFLVAEGSGTRWILDVLHPEGEGKVGLNRLRELGFSSPEQARDNLIQLYAGPSENPHTQRVRQQFTVIAPKLVETIARCGAPDRVLTRITRLLGNLHAAGAVYDVLKLNPQLCEYLVKLADNSAMLTNILIRDPGLLDELSAPGLLAQPLVRDSLEEEFENLLDSCGNESALYRFREGLLFRIGMRDLLGLADVVQVGTELTLLADMCVEKIFEWGNQRIGSRYQDVSAPIAVLGLGKLGGMEMGYGSDLDLVFVCSNNANPNVQEACTALATEIVRGLKERTRHGVLYDVDARLRPYGKQGALVISLNRIEEYYLKEAQPWERLVLLKGRPIAGSKALYNQIPMFIHKIFAETPLKLADLDHIMGLRKKMTSKSPDRDLKTAPGGMVDIEFAVRLLEWQHFDDLQGIPSTSTLEVLRRLSMLGAVQQQSALELERAYLFLRRVENRLRMEEGRSTSELPEDARDLGRRLREEDELLEKVVETKQCVKNICDSILGEIREKCISACG
ncbi:MAG TPA: bifunctional [glutamate--ammonia ligase]-adenylyl-L-tyrosine phosphorylase/[glutamate--ammonia-ligase] adenylyltransferase [Candidatus Hydrogenedentes bacterium]|nr:bifunctional [glutamate--ammonia ligase]-adenylyl-L-tyrosine phosphorylase/[glutamate--ammonia-ligase] adenylyltransferase [Candidatus Hydrogenedentota bacterium]HOL76637.1 bifunctional [glutamate--ammonia ligase]-adenylyl-L-tyrosine phosphorylase/[glutamate--ammonia-ligase] adenylyltransferase [Candidatus Hydrogenedentota bacterium]